MSSYPISLFLRLSPTSATVPATFSQCLVDYFIPDAPSTYVTLRESPYEDEVTLTAACESSGIVLKHADTCPVAALAREKLTNQSLEINSRSVVGYTTSAIIESSDRQILLTKRSALLRTFPGIWVGPGGHVESGETALDALFREILEETGLSVTHADCDAKILSLWESSYPDVLRLPDQLPKRHVLVVYYHIALRNMAADYNSTIRLCPVEVDSLAWVPMSTVESLCANNANTDEAFETQTLKVEGADKNSLRKATEFLKADEISAGTKFALRRWLINNKKT